jgi:hypothetical protein
MCATEQKYIEKLVILSALKLSKSEKTDKEFLSLVKEGIVLWEMTARAIIGRIRARSFIRHLIADTLRREHSFSNPGSGQASELGFPAARFYLF